MIHHAQAEDAEEIARLLRSRGRIVITAPPKSGKTTELIRYAEERFPNGRFAVCCKDEDTGNYITRLHWCLYNGISHSEVCAKRLLGEELEGEEVNTPTVLFPPHLYLPNQFVPVFADNFYLLPNSAQRTILKHKFFVAAVTRENKQDGTQEGENW